jgi:hypothetical protein
MGAAKPTDSESKPKDGRTVVRGETHSAGNLTMEIYLPEDIMPYCGIRVKHRYRWDQFPAGNFERNPIRYVSVV